MNTKRSVEHYRDHELICEANPATRGWSFTISVVTHHGDDSDACSEQSEATFGTDLDALQAARKRGRALIDELIAREDS